MPMHARARALVEMLDLAPHPEGGFYREIWRSGSHVSDTTRSTRSAVTTIYFLLAGDSFSAWHRVRSDEIWHWYEGEELELLQAPADFGSVGSHRLGPAGRVAQPAATVPANCWQAARPLGSYALCGCTVAPGFEFEDFSFLRDDPAAVAGLRQARPDLLALL